MVVAWVFKAGLWSGGQHENSGLAVEGVARRRSGIRAKFALLVEFSGDGGALGEQFPAVGLELRDVVGVLEFVELSIGADGLHLGKQRRGCGGPVAYILGVDRFYNGLEILFEGRRFADAGALAYEPILAALVFLPERPDLSHLSIGGIGEHAGADGDHLHLHIEEFVLWTKLLGRLGIDDL